jgi:hypothetical protein
MISEEDNDKYLAEVLDILRQKFEEGDKSTLLHAIYSWCLMNRPYGVVDNDGKVLAEPQFRPMPEWLRFAFVDAYESATGRYEIKSWNDAFGQPHPKGTQLEKEKLRRRVIERVWALKVEDPERPIDRGLFEQIGEELGIPAGTIDGLYYDERGRWLRESLRDLYEVTALLRSPEKK